MRELESVIVRDKQDEIDTISARKTNLDDFIAEYIQERPLKQSTRTNYKYMYNKYVSGVLGQKKLSNIKYSDIRRLYNSLIDEQGFKPNSMEVVHTILHPIFAVAVRDDLIRKNPNLIYRPQDNGKCEFHITTPKTMAGMRVIPMFDEVKKVLLKEYEYQQAEGFNQIVIDGYSGFIFKNRFDTVYNPHCINRGIERICRDYNAEETAKAEAENRSPVLLPHFTVHNLRHTFCSRMCENESNKVN